MARKTANMTEAVSTLTLDDGSLAFLVSKQAIKAVLAHAADDDTRAALSSVLVGVRDGRAILVACDGHRLAKLEGTRDGFHESLGEASALVSADTMERAAKLCGKAGKVLVQFTGDDVTIREVAFYGNWPAPDGASFTTRTVDAQFPPYDQLMAQPREADAEVKIAPRIKFNPRYLGDVAHVVDACGTDGAIWEFPAHDRSAAYARISGPSGTATVVVMPMAIPKGH